MAETARAPRFACDVMLAHLGRYLRAAGFDTVIAAGHLPDREIIRQAGAEGRWLITLDQKILEHKAARGCTLVLRQGNLEDYAAQLNSCFNLDWLARAFSTCLIDNTPLQPLSDSEAQLVPPHARTQGPLRRCPACGRLYWAGSHYQRMRGTLERLHHRRPPILCPLSGCAGSSAGDGRKKSGPGPLA